MVAFGCGVETSKQILNSRLRLHFLRSECPLQRLCFVKGHNDMHVKKELVVLPAEVVGGVVGACWL